jgi:two-component sensor histidine kinase
MSIQFLRVSQPAPGFQLLDLVEEMNHRVSNEYAEAISSLSLAAAQASSAFARDAIRLAADRLRLHAATHRALLPPPDDALVNLADYVGGFCASLVKSSLAADGVRFAVEAEEVWLGADRAWRVALILAELVRNAARDDLAGGPGVIMLRISQEPGQVTCLVCDNGRAPNNREPVRGLRLVRSLAAEVGGAVQWWFAPGGCLARLQVPETGLPPHDSCAAPIADVAPATRQKGTRSP